jgi:hypothetical protein
VFGPAGSQEVAVHRPDARGARAQAQRIAQVLAGLAYPAAKWQILAEADHYGADSASRAQLWSLPARIYPGLGDVLAALGLVALERRARSRPTGSADARRRPAR